MPASTSAIKTMLCGYEFKVRSLVNETTTQLETIYSQLCFRDVDKDCGVSNRLTISPLPNG